MRIVAILPLALVLALVLAIPAAAAPPVVVTGTIDDDWAFDPPICDFEVRDHDIGTFRETYYYDAQGALLRQHRHWSGTDNFYNPANPNVVLSGHYSANYTFNAVTGEWSYPGTYFSITLPGYGIVFKEAGLYKTANDRLVGIHTSLDPEKMAIFCALLAGD